MHAIAVGSAAAFILILDFVDHGNLGWAVSLAIVIAGLVCTSRFIVSDHTNKDIYSGLFLGVACQLLAAWVTL
jgi:phosphatidylserine synthase